MQLSMIYVLTTYPGIPEFPIGWGLVGYGSSNKGLGDQLR